MLPKYKLDPSKLSLVCAANFESLWEYIRKLRTDPGLVSGFVYQGPISWEQQVGYMALYGNFYWVCFYEKTPVGFIGLMEDDIRIAVETEYQRCGVGRFMVSTLMEHNPEAFAKVKADNSASFEFFKSLGFRVKYYLLGK